MFIVKIKLFYKGEEINFIKKLNKVLKTSNIINLGNDNVEKVIQITEKYCRLDVREIGHFDYVVNLESNIIHYQEKKKSSSYIDTIQLDNRITRGDTENMFKAIWDVINRIM